MPERVAGRVRAGSGTSPSWRLLLQEGAGEEAGLLSSGRGVVPSDFGNKGSLCSATTVSSPRKSGLGATEEGCDVWPVVWGLAEHRAVLKVVGLAPIGFYSLPRLLTSFSSAVANRRCADHWLSLRSERLPAAALGHYAQPFCLLHVFPVWPLRPCYSLCLKGPVTSLDPQGEVSLPLLFSALSVLAQTVPEICVGMSLLDSPTVCITHCTSKINCFLGFMAASSRSEPWVPVSILWGPHWKRKC